MEESVFYIGKGIAGDKHSQESYGTISSIHTSKVFLSFRQADSHRYGSVCTGVGVGEKLFVASATKALINVYVWGKESVDQRLPIPEALNCIDVVHFPTSEGSKTLPNYRVPWLLVGGSKSGKVYIWELLTGNLIFVKDVHYQGINVVKFSPCGNFLVSGGDDSRCIIYKTADIIATSHDDVKPWFTINDHTLSVTDLIIGQGIVNDMKVYTVSKDATLRVYNISKKELITTFVLPTSIECITKDPINRYIYVGLTNGTIRSIPMYKVNNAVLESVGGIGKIITINHDPELLDSFSFHSSKPTQLSVSMDGTKLVSGDEDGNIYVSDVVSKQIVKDFKVNSSVSVLQLISFPKDIFNDSLIHDKKTRLIPPFKRILNQHDQLSHDIYYEIPGTIDADNSFEHWINEKSKQEFEFKTGLVDTTTRNNTNNDNDKLLKLSQAYGDLKAKYDELLNDHKKLLNQ